MEIQQTQTAARQPKVYPFTSLNDDRETQDRLSAILAANAEIAREKTLFRSRREQVEADLMKKPIPIKKAFAYFGLLLGTFPPASMFFKVLYSEHAEAGVVALLCLVNLICAVVGYFSGKLVGKMVLEMEKYSWTAMLLVLPFIGALWGIMTGGAGGVVVFVVGAFFGAIIAALVGSVAVPAFAAFHRLLKRGEMIEQKHFLPLAFGITFAVSAFILGL